ncbi:hypothetical protein BOTBODRAFT_348296 [Botryobasidium botryosum FD-172 SS1]|uniref:Uncharacterized protein n=1 Tax=Botryobasidium botryosum (strain FD-172 SS1) TaxID=930990 RepID=A0A067MEV7_BOTB1|nr:hypothetical protein BOTBODRAFT_348296 [Botryobasidium botryosum FD-172 SS1]
MKSFAVVLAVAAAALAQFTVNSPAGVTECQPTQLSWSGGVPPYFQSGTTLTWLVDLQPQAINIAVKDSSGLVQYSSIINILAGSSSSCVSTSVAVNPAGGSSGPTNSPTGSSPSSSATHASSTPSASATPSNSAATVGARTIGFAMLAGLVGAALF